ncbi:MAG: carboxylate-amine ligase [Marivirga sp.]|jgi:carboxylate-amine ligase
MNTPSKSSFKLFECFGIELEYMLVNKDDISPAPYTDNLIEEKNGTITDELENGIISWSNELVLHVIELKTTLPVNTLEGLADSFHANVKEINQLLDKKGQMLMPTAMHPLLNPLTDLKLWPHHRNEIYEQYNKIFNCKGHGWGNLQSMHINLPFSTDEEFFKLHEAIRILMPLIPALTASSPIYEGKKGDYNDNRLAFYEENQRKIPSITGKVIPESVKDKVAYEAIILQQLYRDIAPYDPEGLLQEEWLNSRGAITRFDRNAIEIRIIDLQECPLADIAVAELIVAVLKRIIYDHNKLPSISENELYQIYRDTITTGMNAVVKNKNYKNIFGTKLQDSVSVKNIWENLLSEIVLSPKSDAVIRNILANGSLSERILSSLGSQPSTEAITECYRELSKCLADNSLFTINK